MTQFLNIIIIINQDIDTIAKKSNIPQKILMPLAKKFNIIRMAENPVAMPTARTRVQPWDA
ncbi:MAG: hypothetical protein KME46_31965 [Brasilonema angustatum HA4187-MV1]|nr:hypothetical protein [Brasilonema angustatum HA4187-MV1]